METTADRRALRGVVIHMVRRRPGMFSRDLAGSLHGAKWTGRCVWCRQHVEGYRKRWHRRCVIYHAAGRGLVNAPFTVQRNGVRINALWPGAWDRPSGCAECGGDEDELDHFLPLSVAHEMGHRWAVRARLPNNLRWLCKACHKAKTKRDMRLLAMLRKPRFMNLRREPAQGSVLTFTGTQN